MRVHPCLGLALLNCKMLPINRGELHQLYNTFSCIWAGWRSATLTTTSLGSKLNALEYLLSTCAMLSPLNMGPQHLELLTSVLAIEGQLPRLSLKPGQQHIKTPLCPHQLHITVHQSAPGTCTIMYKKEIQADFPNCRTQKCEQCDRSFVQMTAYYLHMANHTNSKFVV